MHVKNSTAGSAAEDAFYGDESSAKVLGWGMT